MIAYGVLVGCTVLAYFISSFVNRLKPKRNEVAITVFFLGYLLLACLRDVSVGVDTKNYVAFFQSGKFSDWTRYSYYSDAEPGFVLFSRIVSLFGDDRAFIVAVALVTILPIMYLYRRECGEAVRLSAAYYAGHETAPALLCCAFFLISLLFEMLFSGMRQGIAIALAVPAFYFAKNKKPLLFIGTVALATTFHTSAVVLALLYPVYHAKITQRWLVVVLPAILVVYLFRDTIFSNVILPLAGEEYQDNYTYLTGTSNQIWLAVLFILLALYSCVMLDGSKAGKSEIGLRNILLLAACIHIFTTVHPVVCRINYYFILFIPLALTRVDACCKSRLFFVRQAADVVMPVFFTFYFFALKGDSLGVFDYQFFF